MTRSEAFCNLRVTTRSETFCNLFGQHADGSVTIQICCCKITIYSLQFKVENNLNYKE